MVAGGCLWPPMATRLELVQHKELLLTHGALPTECSCSAPRAGALPHLSCLHCHSCRDLTAELCSSAGRHKQPPARVPQQQRFLWYNKPNLRGTSSVLSSAYIQAHEQCTFIPLHTAELFGSWGSLAGLPLLVGGLHIPYFLGSRFPPSTQTSKSITGSQAKYFISYSHFLVTLFCSICTNSSLKGTGWVLRRRRIKLKQQQDSKAQDMWAERALLAAELSWAKREVCFKQAVQYLPSTILDLAR